MTQFVKGDICFCYPEGSDTYLCAVLDTAGTSGERYMVVNIEKGSVTSVHERELEETPLSVKEIYRGWG